MELKVTISKTELGKLLIYKEDGNGDIINLIIDEANIELLHITSDRCKLWKKTNVSVDEAIEFWNQNNSMPVSCEYCKSYETLSPYRYCPYCGKKYERK